MSQRSLTPVANVPVNRPAADELERAEELAYILSFSLRLAGGRAERITLHRETVEELSQLLHDSIRTAKQLKGHNG